MLAIVIPYYKLTFFEATLQSLADQTDKRFMVYIGDDASLESPDDLLEKYQQKFDFEYYRFEENLGGTSLVKQWERCIAMTKDEEWVMILGDDDVPCLNLVASFYANYSNIDLNTINVVRFATVVINDMGDVLSSDYKHPLLEKTTDFLCRKFSKKTRSSLSEYIFRKSTVIETTFRNFSLAWHSDDMAVLEFSDLENCYSINEATMSVRVSFHSITGDSGLKIKKNQATYEFCGVLFREYSALFSREQKKIILKKLEQAFFNIPLLKNYLILSSYYCSQIGLGELIQFHFRLLKPGAIIILKKAKLFGFVKKIIS